MTTSVPMNVDDDKIKLNEPIPSETDDVWTDMSYFRSKLVSNYIWDFKISNIIIISNLQT